MKKKYCLQLSLPLLILGCTYFQIDKSATDEPVSGSQRVLVRGIMSINADQEQDKIQLCNSQTTYNIYLNDDIYQEAQSLSALVKPFYAEVYGQFNSTSGTTILNVTQLNAMSKEQDLCKNPTQETRAFGEEPFWFVTISNKNLSYHQLGAEKIEFELISQEILPRKRHYLANQAELTLEQKHCKDTMSDSIYGWQARFIRDEKIQQGCALIASQDMDAIER